MDLAMLKERLYQAWQRCHDLEKQNSEAGEKLMAILAHTIEAAHGLSDEDSADLSEFIDRLLVEDAVITDDLLEHMKEFRKGLGV